MFNDKGVLILLGTAVAAEEIVQTAYLYIPWQTLSCQLHQLDMPFLDTSIVVVPIWDISRQTSRNSSCGDILEASEWSAPCSQKGHWSQLSESADRSGRLTCSNLLD